MTAAFVYGWQLTLDILATFPLLPVVNYFLTKMQSSLAAKELHAYSTAGGVAEEVLTAIRTVAVLGGQDKEAERFEQSLVPATKMGVRRGLASAVAIGLTWAITYASYGLAFWYGIQLVIDSCLSNNGYDAATLNVVFFNMLFSSIRIGQTSPFFESFSVARAAASSIFEVIDRVPSIDSSSKEGQRPEKIKGDIQFENVHFNYPSRPNVPIFKRISFQVKAGQTVALVGPSGSGKSSCIQLIQRFYDPSQGQVQLDGVALSDLNVRWLRNQIGVVGQEPVLFATSIGENIKYGLEGATQEDVERAARQANAHDFIMQLSQKYDTPVGERGAQLSGGQKQRIAIARALIRNPKILLLDEATSALDTNSEAVVQQALDQARQGRTTIIVAHRLTTIRNADVIFVINSGVVKVSLGLYDQFLKSINSITFF